MTWIVTSVSVIAGSTAYQAKEARKAQKQARKDQLADQRRARRSEVFAETEGAGTGQLGQISLEIDDELDEDESSSVSI